MEIHQSVLSITESLLPGDLLFQFRSGGEAEWAISRVFAGRDGAAINHVALYDGDGAVIEAVMPFVKKTPLPQFIDQSVKDNYGRPCVVVCRVISDYGQLIPSALAFAEQQLAAPYNNHYQNLQSNSKNSWYCSELIIHAFRQANEGFFLFEETQMSFRDMDSGEPLPYWVEYYKTINEKIPEGNNGSHPALISRSEKLNVIRTMGTLPVTNLTYFNNNDMLA